MIHIYPSNVKMLLYHITKWLKWGQFQSHSKRCGLCLSCAEEAWLLCPSLWPLCLPLLVKDMWSLHQSLIMKEVRLLYLFLTVRGVASVPACLEVWPLCRSLLVEAWLLCLLCGFYGRFSQATMWFLCQFQICFSLHFIYFSNFSLDVCRYLVLDIADNPVENIIKYFQMVCYSLVDQVRCRITSLSIMMIFFISSFCLSSQTKEFIDGCLETGGKWLIGETGSVVYIIYGIVYNPDLVYNHLSWWWLNI